MTKIKQLLKNKVFLYGLLLLFSIFLACCCNDYDYDLYARFIVGENFFEKGVFNYYDFLSYTPTHKWYDHEYGASLIFYLFYKYLGPFGLILIQGLLMFFTSFLIMKTQQLQKHAYPSSILFMGIFLLLFSHHNPSLVRCHMFSFLFFAGFLYILEKTRIAFLNSRSSKVIWLIPPLTVLWNNLHGGVVSGLGIVFIYMIGAALSKQNWRKYLTVLVISTFLLVINPYGIEYLKFLLSANTKSRSYIVEWWSVFAKRHVIYYYPLFIIGLFTVFLKIFDFVEKRKIDIIKFLVLATTLYLGMVHVKLLSLPLITVVSLFHNEIMNLFDKKKFKIMEGLAYIAVVITIFFIPLTNPLAARTDIDKFPVKEVEFIKINNLKGNIMTEFGLGSYVSYKLYPDNLIYMDGRYEEVYNDEEFEKLMNYEQEKEGWDNIFKAYHTDVLLPEKTIPVYKTLEKQNDWVKIYEGNLCGVFVRKDKVRKNYKMPENNIEYYVKNEFVNKGYFGKKNTGKNNGK